jgi:hypothetical protein
VANNQTHNNTTIITVYASLHHFIGYKWDQPRICKGDETTTNHPLPCSQYLVRNQRSCFFKRGDWKRVFGLWRERGICRVGRENFTGHKHLMYVGVIIMIIMVCVLLAAINF